MSVPGFNCLHSTITGTEAQELLMNEGFDGSFLLRPSSTTPGDYSLSVRRGNEVVHMKIQNNGDYYNFSGGEVFADLHQLIHYYSVGEGKDHLVETNSKSIKLQKPLCVPSHRSERWFHPNINSTGAEEELKEIGKKGMFLVRESKSIQGGFVLSYNAGSEVIHVVITRDLGKYSVDNGSSSFGSLSALVEYYTKNSLNVICNNKKYSFKLEQPLFGGVVDLTTLDVKIESMARSRDGGPTAFAEEFAHIQQFDNLKNKSMLAGRLHENKPKNRYKNIIPYDETRVVLKSKNKGVSCSDYINANYIKAPEQLVKVSKVYIATQGCVEATVLDFWSMVWQENVVFIVMTTKLVENGKRKCFHYWPESTETSLSMNTHQGKMEVSLTYSEKRGSYVFRTFDVLCQKKTRTIFHYHFQHWPDRCAPNEVSSVLEFVLEINDHSKRINHPSHVPWIVHCSAGIGRTGTFILLDILINHILNNGSHVSILRVLIALRAQRAGLVQLETQYVFVYNALQLFVNQFHPVNHINQEDGDRNASHSRRMNEYQDL